MDANCAVLKPAGLWLQIYGRLCHWAQTNSSVRPQTADSHLIILETWLLSMVIVISPCIRRRTSYSGR